MECRPAGRSRSAGRRGDSAVFHGFSTALDRSRTFLLRLPNIPKLPLFRADASPPRVRRSEAHRVRLVRQHLDVDPERPPSLQKIPAFPPYLGRLRRSVVNFSMSAVRETHPDPVHAAGSAGRMDSAGFRHGTCIVDQEVEKPSQPLPECVDLVLPVAMLQPRQGLQRRPGTMSGASHPPSDGWKRGAVGYGCRKRTHVREACGGAIRPGGEGIHSSHGHFGLSVGRFRSPSFVVQRLPGGRPSCRSPFSRGPGLLAALTTRDVGFVRMPAPAGRTATATRRRSPVVNRAVPTPANPAGTSGGWMGRTRTGPRTRLRGP